MQLGLVCDSGAEVWRPCWKGSAKGRTRHNRADHHPQLVYGTAARGASSTGQPREGRGRSGILVRGTYLVSHRRGTRYTAPIDTVRILRVIPRCVTHRISSQTHRLSATGDNETHFHPVINRILDPRLMISELNLNGEPPKSICASERTKST